MAGDCSPRVLVDQDVFRPNDFFVHKQVTQAPASPLAALGGLLESTSPCLPVTSPAAFLLAWHQTPSFLSACLQVLGIQSGCLGQDAWRDNNCRSIWGMFISLAGAVISGYLIRSAWVRTCWPCLDPGALSPAW